jgi:hypothetical protein
MVDLVVVGDLEACGHGPPEGPKAHDTTTAAA